MPGRRVGLILRKTGAVHPCGHAEIVCRVQRPAAKTCQQAARLPRAPVMSKGWQGKAKPKRVAGGRSWSGALLVPGLVVLLLLGSLLVLALLMTRAPAAAAPAGSAAASSRMQPAADGKCEDRNEMCAAWHKGGACRRSRSGAPARSNCPPWQCPSSAPAPPHWAPSRPTRHPATASGARASRLPCRPFLRL